MIETMVIEASELLQHDAISLGNGRFGIIENEPMIKMKL
jgi:hypothetical protein